jgi:hypothetical protein
MRIRLAPLAALALVAAPFVAPACSAAPSLLGKSSDPIINGVVDDSSHDAVVMIMTIIDRSTGEIAGCSGTLISPSVVVTARHCVSNLSADQMSVTTDFAPSDMYVWTGVSPKWGSADPFSTAIAQPTKIVHTSSTTLANNDIALLVLDKKLSPTAKIRLTSPPTLGETVMAIGYGVTQSDGAPTATDQLHQRYIRKSLSVLDVGPDTTNGIGSHEIVLGEATCHGDSGGPIMDEATGALLAVTSRGGNGASENSSYPAATCVDGMGLTTYNLYTRVDGFADLINSTVASVGESITAEDGSTTSPTGTATGGAKNPLGGACSGPNDCTTNLCVNDGGNQVCSQTCDSANPCPTGFDCTSGYCIASSGSSGGADAGGTGSTGGTGGSGGTAAGTTRHGGCSVHAGSSREAGWVTFGLGALGLIASRRRRPRLEERANE